MTKALEYRHKDDKRCVLISTRSQAYQIRFHERCGAVRVTNVQPLCLIMD